MMKYKLYTRALSLLTVFGLLLTGLVLPAVAVPAIDTANSPNTFTANDESLTADKIILQADDPCIAEESKILQYVDSAQFNAAEHTQRLSELEDLNTYVFANADGTRSVYVMYENVKYVDDNGIVKEKDISLKKKADGFGIVQNDVELLIPNNPVQGIDLEYAGYAVKLIPQGLVGAVSAVQSDNSVVYDKAYGDQTKLVYTPLLSGIKEDIVLNEYTADVTYTFILETDGLYLCSNEDGYYLTDSEKSKPVFYLGDVLIYDAVGRPDKGTMAVETISAGQKYLLTVTANDAFLSDPTTVYPVTIDPSITISDTTANNSIIDAPIYSGYPNMNCGTYIYNRVGTPSQDYGIGRTVVKLSGLINQNEYQSITANQITNVEFNVKEATGGLTQTVNLHPLTTNTTWTETNVTWNNVGSYSTDINCGNTIYCNQRTAFNITELVKAWKNNTYSAEAGFILMNANESNDAALCASECATPSNRPYVVMTYKVEVEVSAPSIYMEVGDTKQMSYSTNPTGLSVSWSSSSPSIATVSSSGLVTAVSAGMTRIVAKYTDSSTGVTSSDHMYLYIEDSLDSIGIKDNTKYYIMNYDSGRYLSLEFLSGANNTNVYTRPRGVSTLSQWKTEKQIDGTVQLINQYYSHGMVLNATGNNIDTYTDNSASCQKFYISRIETGTYKGLYYIRYGSYYVTQDDDYNVYLLSRKTSSAVWSFMAVEKEDADLFSFQYIDENNEPYNSTANNALFSTTFGNLGYDTYAYFENRSAATAYANLCFNGDIFVFRGHGNAGIIAFKDSNGSSFGHITVNSYTSTNANRNYIESCGSNQLASLRCVMYIGCKTGVDFEHTSGTYNLVDATFEKGAHFVLGTTETVERPDSDAFLKGFLDELSKNRSDLYTCIDKGVILAGDVDSATGRYPLYMVGDSKQYLN